MKTLRSLLFISAFFVGAVEPAAAQVRPTFYFGGGPTFPQNRFADFQDPGFNLQVGGGVRAGRAIELLGEFDFHDLGIKGEALRRLQVPDGSTRLYSVTGNVKINVIPVGPVNVYAIGGGGWYRRTVEFTQPTTSVVTVFDPFFGFYPAAVPSNQVIGSVTRDAGGYNFGAGIEFRIRGTGLYLESRFHRAYHNPTNTTMTPITLGIRF